MISSIPCSRTLIRLKAEKTHYIFFHPSLKKNDKKRSFVSFVSMQGGFVSEMFEKCFTAHYNKYLGLQMVIARGLTIGGTNGGRPRAYKTYRKNVHF